MCPGPLSFLNVKMVGTSSGSGRGIEVVAPFTGVAFRVTLWFDLLVKWPQPVNAAFSVRAMLWVTELLNSVCFVPKSVWLVEFVVSVEFPVLLLESLSIESGPGVPR